MYKLTAIVITGGAMRRLAALLAMAIIVSGLNPTFAQTTPVRLDNPNFDGNLSGWEQQVFPEQNKGIIFATEKDGYRGTKSARITSGGKGGGSLVQSFKAEGYSSIHVSGMVKTEGVEGMASIDCAMIGDSPPRLPLPKCSPDMSGDSDWTKVDGNFQVQAGAKMVRISLTLAGTGSALFDEIEVTAVKGQPAVQGNIEIEKNFVDDPGFEDVSNGSFTKWSKKEGTGKLTVSKDSHEGSTCARIDNDADNAFKVVSEINLSDVQNPIGIVAWIKTKNVKSAYVTIELPGKSGGGGRQRPSPQMAKTAPDNIDSEEWTRVQAFIMLPQGTGSVSVVCVADGSGTVWFDDVTVGTIKRQERKSTGEYEELWVENPISKVRLCTHAFKPQRFDPQKQYPAVFVLPGGNGYGTQLEASGLTTKLANSLDAVVVVFDPDGRGLTKDGTDDFSGEIHQAGFNAVTKQIATLPYVDKTNMGYYTMSFGLILGACTAGRYVDDPPIKYILDWEGPDGHLCPTNHLGKYDMDFWAPREALDYIKKFPGIYIRLQSEKDHAQKTTDHAIRMINAATNKQFGGEGQTIYSRVNMKDGQYANPPNKTYKDGQTPVWMPESMDRQLDDSVVSILRELISTKPEFVPPSKTSASVTKGRNRLGFLNAYGFPKYSKDMTKKYFDSLGVKNEEEFDSKISTELAPLNPTVARIDFFLWAGDEWKQKFAAMKLPSWEEIRLVGTLNFRDPGYDTETARKVMEIVEYFDGDGDGDNPFGVVIKDWQIENEINMKGVFWKGTPQEYAHHLQNCATAAKTADPTCKIVMAGEACDVTNDTYPQILKALDHRQAFDAVDIHVYTDSKERNAVTYFADRFKGYLRDAGFENDIPMWMTEFGVTQGKVKNLTANDENAQATTFAMRAIQASAGNFEGSCYISLVDLYPDQINKGLFDSMGLISSGSTAKEKPWTKRKIYWTYQKMTDMFSMVSFEGVEKSTFFGDNITAYKFNRPGLEPLILAYVGNVTSIPKDKQVQFTQPFTYYPIVTGDQNGEPAKGITVLPVEREKIAKFAEDLLKGPVAIVLGDTSSISARLGIYDTVLPTCLDNTSCSPYYSKDARTELGSGWMLMRPKLDFLGNAKSWPSNDTVIGDMCQNNIDPVFDFSEFPGLDQEVMLEAAGQIAERYDSDGLNDVFGSFTATRFRLAPTLTQTAEDFAALVPEFDRAIKKSNRNATLIIGGEKPFEWWSDVFAKLNGVGSGRDKKSFDTFDIPLFMSVAGDPDKNNKAFFESIDKYRKALDSSKLQYASVSTMQLSTYSGSPEGYPEQSESVQAGELVKLYSLAAATKSSLIGFDGRQTLTGSSLFNPDGTKKLAYWTVTELSKTFAQVRNTGRITPGDEDFGARFFNRSNDGLWATRFGVGSSTIVVGWIDSDKPPMFSALDYGLPFTSAIELTYLVPEQPVKGSPIFKKLLIGGKDGKFTIPTDRLDPFVIRPTGEEIEPFMVVLNPPELDLDPGQIGTVKVRILGCEGTSKLSFPSTKSLPVELVSKEPDANGEYMLRVSTDASNKGKTITVKITAICENGQQTSADLSVTVSNQNITNISLWVGKTTALINGVQTTLAVPPTIVEGKTLVPVRFISEAFGAKVNWDQKEQRIELIFGYLEDGSYTKKVTLWIGKKTAQADYGSKLPAYRDYTLDVAPKIISGTTMVPIRFLSDVLGAKTVWDDKEKRIDITWTPF